MSLIKVTGLNFDGKTFSQQKISIEKISWQRRLDFAELPEVEKSKSNPFGWVKVKGTIDGFEIKKYHLMPLGNGNLFLPVKAEIRKSIKKNAGDYVHIILYPDTEPLEMLLCLQDEPTAFKFFNSLSESERRYYINWIYSAKKEETKVSRLAKSIDKLLKKEKFSTIQEIIWIISQIGLLVPVECGQ
jgi:hypothetical protein